MFEESESIELGNDLVTIFYARFDAAVTSTDHIIGRPPSTQQQ
jgi:hypothetical protein